MLALALPLLLSLQMVAELELCVLETQGLPATEAACGSVAVETATTSGERLRIGFAVLEATSDRKRPDPVVILPGGPGQAGTELAGLIAMALTEVRRDRDVVLFDPRGTGRSHKLECKDERSVEERARASDEEEVRRLAECHGSLTLDPKTITTQAIASDLDGVRQALGVSTWNLVGVSYGTRVALAYDRAFPGKARSLVLDGVVPFSMVLGEHASQDAHRALVALDERCEKASGCRQESLVSLATSLRKRLERAPVDVTLPHPTTGEPLTLPIDADHALSVLRMGLYSDEGAALVPLLLHAAAPPPVGSSDLRGFAAQLVMMEQLEASIATPMHLAIVCAEDEPFREARDAGPSTVFPNDLGDMAKVCAAWPHATVDADFHDDSPSSPTPALLLSGSADPITPPRYGEAARETLPHSIHVIGEGIGHNLLFRGCVPQLIATFLERPDPQTLQTSCTGKLGPFPVFVDRLGPLP